MCVSADPTSSPGYQFMDFYQLEIIRHVRFYSDSQHPDTQGRREPFIMAVIGHSGWQDQDVCVVTARHSHSTGAAASVGS